jgi:hypothetical protein
MPITDLDRQELSVATKTARRAGEQALDCSGYRVLIDHTGKQATTRIVISHQSGAGAIRTADVSTIVRACGLEVHYYRWLDDGLELTWA